MSQHPLFADDMQEIVTSFVVETREILERLDRDLLQLEQTPGDKALVDEIFRAVHTVKGTAGFLSLEQFTVLAHHFEDVLNRLRRGELVFHPSMMDTMLAAFDLMKVLLQQVEDKTIVPVAMDEITASLEAIAREEQPSAVGFEIAASHTDTPDAIPVEPGEGEEDKDPTDTHDSIGAVTEKSVPSPQTSNPNRTEQSVSTVRVEVARLDSLMNLVGELVLGRNRLLQIVEDLPGAPSLDPVRELSDTALQIDAITKELQAAVMRTRMVQIGRVLNKFPRLVRDLAREFDKQIELVLEGEETELDKSVVEEISDPLVHLIRNAADHGIELPGERAAAGKPAVGTIRIAAAQEGNQIVIRIDDDGAGIDPEKLKQIAVAKNLVSPSEASDLTDSEAFALIFRPGFSTASHVSKVSGRGVGMDVVKTNISRLNGTVSIESKPGYGTQFVVRLPLTLAIIHCLLVRVGDEIFAVPLHAIAEVVRLTPADVATIQGHEVIRLRNEVIPLLRVDEAMECAPVHDESRLYAVIAAFGQQRIGLVVGGLLGQKEIVIKPLGDYLGKIPGVSGSSIIGDGRVIMILDVGELIQIRTDQRRLRASA